MNPRKSERRLQDQINAFWEDIQPPNNDYIMGAYVVAMEEADETAQPWAVLYNSNNEDDALKTVTRDSSPNSQFSYLNVETVVGGRAGNPSDAPVSEIIDNGNGLVRTEWPSVNGKMPGSKKLSTPTDFTKIKHLAFARKTELRADGKQAFSGKPFIQTMHYRASLSKQQAASLANDYLNKEFPEFASRLKLKDVSERVSGSLRADGTAVSSTNGYLVQFSVLSDDIPVWGNYVNVSFQGDNIEAVHFLCNNETQSSSQDVQGLDGRAALLAALPDIKNVLGINSQYEVFKAKLFFVNRSTVQGLTANLANDFIPAWHLVINKSYKGSGSVRELHEVWIDAVTGKLLGHKRY